MNIYIKAEGWTQTFELMGVGRDHCTLKDLHDNDNIFQATAESILNATSMNAEDLVEIGRAASRNNQEALNFYRLKYPRG